VPPHARLRRIWRSLEALLERGTRTLTEGRRRHANGKRQQCNLSNNCETGVAHGVSPFAVVFVSILRLVQVPYGGASAYYNELLFAILPSIVTLGFGALLGSAIYGN
jgi:hypothetical protein